MKFSDIMAEAVLSIEKSCLLHKLFEHILQLCYCVKCSFEKVKEKSSDAVCTVLCKAYRQIHVSETQFACIPSKD